MLLCILQCGHSPPKYDSPQNISCAESESRLEMQAGEGLGL